MYTVVNDIKRSFAVFSALFITVITSKVKGHDQCNMQELTDCAKPLSVLTDSGLTFISNKTDLDKICPDLKEAIRCIHSFSRRCMSHEHRRHFKKLFHGTGLMVHELCRNGTYQEEYLKHAPCMTKVEPQTEVCLKRYSKAMEEIQSNTPELNISEPDTVGVLKKKREAADEGIRNVCCSFQEYVECSTHTMRRQCGAEAAEFSRNFLDRMSSSMIQLHCAEYGRRECGLISASSQIENSALAIIVLSVLALFLR